MILYYVFQHIVLTLGLALCAHHMPKWFHLAAIPRALLAASLTPHIIGLLVMALAEMGVHAPVFYAHGPTVLGAFMLAMSLPRLIRRVGGGCSLSRISVFGIALTAICLLFAIQLVRILLENAGTLNVFAHDFNVYLTAAKVFAAKPSVDSMPSFFGGPGDVIVVHPHSFIFEAYLAQSLMLGHDQSFPPLDFLARLAQQSTMVYLLLAISAASIAAGGRSAIVAAMCLTAYIPWVYYISGALSRDAFRLIPIIGFILILSSLGLNFRSALVRRGALAGGFAAITIMSHTLGLMVSAMTAACILPYAFLLRRPSWRAWGLYLVPLTLIGGLSIVRYVQNYLNTGGFLGYGLQYSIYKDTWLESLLSKAWTAEGQSWAVIFGTLFDRYGWYMQLTTVAVSCFAESPRESRRLFG